MITGVGIDIVETERIMEKVAKKNGLKEKIFSVGEIAFCERNRNPSQHYAARFAAKEAFLKATGQGLRLGYDLCDIEVMHDDLEKPFLQLNGKYKSMASENHWNKIHLSLSHTQTTACAVVIIES